MFKPKVIATAKSYYKDKFGIPRQSLLVDNIPTKIVFEKAFSNPDFFRGIEGFSHLWIIWEFSSSKQKLSPTVRPPKLGGNKRMGVFATRSPFRPNPIGLSLVKLIGTEQINGQFVLIVDGADLLDGTPILDIKPYLPYVESRQDAVGSFTETTSKVRLYVDFPQNLANQLDDKDVENIIDLLSLDPRPGYQNDDRIYGMFYKNYNINFQIIDERIVVTDIQKFD